MNIASISEAALLIGDPARANMLFALKDDGDISAKDLAAIAGVAPSTASEHLAKLIRAGLITVRAAGRHRYYRLAGPSIAEVLESIEVVAHALAPKGPGRISQDPSVLNARCCYDHIAGRLGVQLAHAMMAAGSIVQSPHGYDLSPKGAAWLSSLGADADKLRRDPRRFLRLCPDWSEGSFHIGGATGAAILKAFIAQGWLRRSRGTTALQISPSGARMLNSTFGIALRAPI